MPWRAGSSSRSTSALRAASRAGDAPPCRLPWIWRFSPASRTLSGPRVGAILREAGRIRCFGTLGSSTLTEIVGATHAGTAGGHRHHTDQVRRYRFGGDTFAGGVACHSPRLRNGGPTPALCGRIRDRSRPRVDGLGPSRQGHLVNSCLRGTCPRYGCLEGSRAVDGTIRALSCPLAFHTSRALQQGVAKTLEEVAAGASIGNQTLIFLALFKAVEYGCLGVIIGWVQQRSWGGMLAHAAAGLTVGILFGSAIVSFTYWTAPEPLATPDLVSRSANEILFPVGCSLVLFAATAVGKRAEG